MSKFGKASLDNNQFESFKYFKLKTPDITKGEEIFELPPLRFMPAMYSYAESGQWKFFYGQHYGHVRNNPRNLDKPKATPFGCIQRKNILDPCPKCVEIEGVRDRVRVREQEITTKNPNLKEAALKDVFGKDSIRGELTKWLRTHNCDKKFWMNVMTMDGQFGVLQLSYQTTEQVLMPVLRQLQGEGTDAFDLDGGVFFHLTRTGRAPNVTDRIVPYTEKVDIGGGRIAAVTKPAPLTTEQREKALRVLPDLKTGVVKFISAETMQALVDSSGDPDETDRIWPVEARKVEVAATTTATTTDTDGVDYEDEAAEEVAVTMVTTPIAVPTSLNKVTVSALPQDPTEAELEAKLAAIRAKRVAAATTVTTPKTTPTQDSAVEDFLKDFEVPA